MPSSRIRFSKLEALGNDFMLVDARDQVFAPATGQIRRLADRRLGIGFDQLLILSASSRAECHCAVSIFNSDGRPARQCGNGMRAIALWLKRNQELSSRTCLDTAGGIVRLQFESPERITATLAVPDFHPSAWGFSSDAKNWVETLDEQSFELHGVSMGNPHVVIYLDSRPDPVLLERLAARIVSHPALSDGANVSLARALDRRHVELAVFERGAGPTPACGSAACAAAAVLISQGLVDSPVTIAQAGGKLVVNWPASDQPVEMTGPARLVFHGALEPEPEIEP
jgi:diaminopimelate epimerase